MSLQKTAGLASCCLLVVMSLFLPPAAAGAECEAPAGWFTGIPSVPTFEPQSPCQFQQWSWQSFLALLEKDRSHPTPLYFTWPLPKNSIFDLYCERVCNSDARLPQNPCGGPLTQEVVNATTQPGFVPAGTSGELIDQAGKPVYFTSHVSPEWVEFVTRRQLYDNKVVEGANPRLAFRPGAVEIKSSWRLAQDMRPAEKAQYYTTSACVIPEDHSPPFQTELALVGFHITGGAPHHPELLWATFEHVRNAPFCDETPAPGSWAFYDGRTNCRARPDACNQPNLLGPDQDRPINVCRKSPYGGADLRTSRQIAELNDDVHARLPRDSKWRFYELVGTLWGADPTPQDAPIFNLQEPSGSPLLSNTTLETFKQNVSCFGCHNGQFPGELAKGAGGSPSIFQTKNLFVSHVVLFPIFFAAEECSAICPREGSAADTKRKR